MISLRLKAGDIVEIPDGIFRFARELSNNRMLFVRDSTQGEMFLTEAQFEKLIRSEQLRRVRTHLDREGREVPNTEFESDPEGASEKARSIAFYVREWVKDPCARSDRGLIEFIKRTSKKAKARNLVFVPKVGALRNWIRKYLEAGRRTVAALEDQTGRTPRQSKLEIVVNAAMRRTVAWYYAKRPRNGIDAYARLMKFIKKINSLGRMRYGDEWTEVKPPAESTFYDRIKKAENRDNWASKYGTDAARRKFAGVSPALEATQILQYVMIDQTIADVWLYDDERDLPLGRPTIAIAIDLFSRMILALVITFEPPSIYTAMRALYESNRPKDYWREEYRILRYDYDAWGKTDTVIVDNALEQTGVSYQDACEDAGISVRWAPVKNPEYKSFIERFNDTFNKLVMHRCQGGVPLPPNLMRKFGLNPAEDACMSLNAFMSVSLRAMSDVYQNRVHRGIGMAPARAWKESKAKHGREFIDDLASLSRALGAYGEGKLTREGVRFRTMRFHDKDGVSHLLNELSGREPARSQRIGSATVNVKFKYDPSDASRIHVWNPLTRRYVRLDNVDKKFASGCLSFRHAEEIARYAKNENLAFQSDEEKWAVRDAIRVEIERAAGPTAKSSAIRKARRLLHPAPPITGDTVQVVQITPSAGGPPNLDVKARIAMHERADDGFAEKGPRRGRPKSTRKKQASDSKTAPKLVGARLVARDPSPEKPLYPKTSDAFAGLGIKKVREIPWVNSAKTKEKGR